MDYVEETRRVQGILRQIDTAGMPFGARLRLGLAPMENCRSFTIEAHFHIADRDSADRGEPIRARVGMPLPDSLKHFVSDCYVRIGEEEAEIVRAAHALLSRAVQHEVDEQFLYQGVRVFDPHPKKVAIVGKNRPDDKIFEDDIPY